MPVSISLSELCNTIVDTLHTQFDKAYWIRAEISELNVRGGHAYLELVEKVPEKEMFLAKVRATCWANVFAMLRPYFESETAQTLRSGLQVLVSATVEFHPVYGLSLNIIDIDPTYTLGDLLRQKQETVARLLAEGVMDMNKQLVIPLLPQRLAVISSEMAAGYGDFCHQLQHNEKGFAFRITLFPAIMQGERAEQSIIAELEHIFAQVEDFDVVVIIRGGGATTDLTCFDNYQLALNCAQFPLPIIAGIGHQRDVSVLDMVAHTSVKTPTAAAELLIGFLLEQDTRIAEAAQSLLHATQSYTLTLHAQLENVSVRIRSAFANRINLQWNHVQLLQKTVELHSPERILRQGYTITLADGRPVISAKAVVSGQLLTTEFADGRITSTAE